MRCPQISKMSTSKTSKRPGFLMLVPPTARLGPRFAAVLEQLRAAGPQRLALLTDFDQTWPGASKEIGFWCLFCSIQG